MPFADYKNFNECKIDMMKKGKDEDSAKKICGAMQAKAESSKDWSTLEYFVPITEKTKNDDGFFIEGVAINETTTRNNVKYEGGELRNAANTLQGKPILKDHENKVDAIVGRVRKSWFDETARSIKFKGQIMDEKIKEMISDGRIQHVSIGAKVNSLKKSEKEGDNCVIAEGIEILELSLTPVPGDAAATLTQALAESYDLYKEQMEYKCKVCEEEFKTEKELDKHMMMEHPKKMENVSDNKSLEANNMNDELVKENERLKAQLAKAEAESVAREMIETAELTKEYSLLCEKLGIPKKESSQMSKEALQVVVDVLKSKMKNEETKMKGIVKEEAMPISSLNWDGYAVENHNGKITMWKEWYKRN